LIIVCVLETDFHEKVTQLEEKSSEQAASLLCDELLKSDHPQWFALFKGALREESKLLTQRSVCFRASAVA
jgi:hypothetical protein